jgi:hypothetical protein
MKNHKAAWYGDWEVQFPKKVVHHNRRGLRALEFLRDSHLEVEGVVEYFGGTGNHSRQVQEVFHPEWHLVFDPHPAAYAHLRALPLPLKVIREEFAVATARELYPDLVVLDSNIVTLKTVQDELLL